MIEFVKGDFFDFDADVRVNTVNCVGVMGAGVALAFKQKYPAMFKEYVKQCKEGLIRPGLPSVWNNGDMFSKGIEIINFPTKDHWRKPSEYEYVEIGLRWLSEYLGQKSGLTVTLPALGCGHGGLDWQKVKILIENYLGDSPHRILVFEPSSSKNAGKQAPLSADNAQLLLKYKVETIGRESDIYPELLRKYSEKELYLFGCKIANGRYDVSILSSSKPTLVEMKVIHKLVEHCKNNNLSILFGGSAFDKKVAVEAASCGVKVGVFLPTGILNSAKKLIEGEGINSLTLISIGDPFESFDRKAYMPSILSRIFLADNVVFTTDRLEWLSKQKKSLSNADAKYYHINYQSLSQKDIVAIEDLLSEPIEIDNENVSFDCVN